jgi:DNA polymerase III subunit beta
MKILFDKETLLTKLKIAIMFIPKKPVLPIYDNFLIEYISDGQVVVTAQNGEKQISIQCPVISCDTKGAIVIPARILLSTISMLTEPDVTIKYKNNKCEISCGGSTYKLSSESSSNFPKMGKVNAKYQCSLSGSSLKDIIETSSKFADEKNVVESLKGVCLREINGVIFALSSNNVSISRMIPPIRSIEKWADVMIPANVMQTIFKVFNDSDIIDVVHDGNQIEIYTQESVVTALILVGKFPDIEKFYSTKPTYSIIFNTTESLMALNRLSMLSDEESTGVTIWQQKTKLTEMMGWKRFPSPTKGMTK